MEGTPFGRYRLIEQLGHGGMGEVWRAYDSAIDRVVALKMLLPHLTEDPDFDQRFRREARAAARLDDPHVVPIYDVGEIEGRLYVTMRLVTGTDLHTLLGEGPLEAHRAVGIIEQVASALHHAHRTGLVHRDVKPSNILLGENDFAYLIDFGIARTAEETGVTATGTPIGTWGYMAPERFNTGEIHPSSDIYALACVLYECLTGQGPFPGNTFEQIASGHIFAPPPRPSAKQGNIPAALDEVIVTGLAKKPADRYPTAVEMAAAARRVITDPGYSAIFPQQSPAPAAGGPSTRSWSQQPWTQIGPPNDPAYALDATHHGGPRFSPPTPPDQDRRRLGVLIGALVLIVAVIAAAGFAVVGLDGDDEPSAATTPTSTGASGGDFTGTYRADYGPGTDLQGNPVADAPATTTSWAVVSTCGESGCVANAANISGSGSALISNFTFDQLGGNWEAVGLTSTDCGAGPTEIWVTMSLQTQPDGSLTGETVRASTDGACSARRTVMFTRTGDVDLSKVPDPAVLPPRSVSAADGLFGTYSQTTSFADGNVVAGQPLTAETYCLRGGDRCMSLFHGPDGVVTLIYADDKWTRNEAGVVACAMGGTAQVTIRAEYPMPQSLQDPIPVLAGRGEQTVSAGGACTGGGPFEDTFERTGD